MRTRSMSRVISSTTINDVAEIGLTVDFEDKPKLRILDGSVSDYRIVPVTHRFPRGTYVRAVARVSAVCRLR